MDYYKRLVLIAMGAAVLAGCVETFKGIRVEPMQCRDTKGVIVNCGGAHKK